MDAGTTEIAVGRNVWQRGDPTQIFDAFDGTVSGEPIGGTVLDR